MILEKLSYVITPRSSVDHFFERKNVFFVLGMGRSGTKLLAELLNRGERCRVFHEPVREDFDAIVTRDDHYIRKRKKMMYYRLKKEDFETYGEVNSNLRYHAEALRKYFPEATFIHNIRDGRDVTRSLMARAHYTDDGIGHHELKPLPDDPYYDIWDSFSRFQKVCWLWKDAVEKTEEHCTHTVRFENWTRDYNEFDELLTMTDVRIPKERWEEAMNISTHPTARYSIPHWREWDEERVHTFNEICGEMMYRHGYSWD